MQALEHLAIVRGADGAEEDVGDNLRQLAVGLDLLGCERHVWGGSGGSVSCAEGSRVVGSRADGRGRGAARAVTLGASRATAGMGSDRIGRAGNSIETRDERMARAPCDGRGAREKRPRPMSRPRGARARDEEKNGRGAGAHRSAGT